MRTALKRIVLSIILCSIFFGLKSEPIDSTIWAMLKNKKSPVSLSYKLPNGWDTPTEECGVGEVGEYWTFPLCVAMKLTAFKEELPLYCENIEPSKEGDMDYGMRLFSSYCAGFSGNWDEHWSPRYTDSTVYPKVMKQLKNSLIQKAVWTFIEPALKHQVKTMQLKFQGIVVLSYEYASGYFKKYDVKKAREWYVKDVENHEFAYKDYLGNMHPSRKITALVERLMFKWKVLDYKSVTSWSTTIGAWLKKVLGENYTKSKAYWGK